MGTEPNFREFKCPVDGAALVTDAAKSPGTLFLCPHCAGLLVLDDKARIKQHLSTAAFEGKPLYVKSAIACPACRGAMLTPNDSNLKQVSTCGQCGATWLTSSQKPQKGSRKPLWLMFAALLGIVIAYLWAKTGDIGDAVRTGAWMSPALWLVSYFSTRPKHLPRPRSQRFLSGAWATIRIAAVLGFGVLAAGAAVDILIEMIRTRNVDDLLTFVMLVLVVTLCVWFAIFESRAKDQANR